MSLKDLKKVKEAALKNYERGIVKADVNTLVHTITFDSPQLTYMFGGFRYDRIHQNFGPESSGKSSLYTYIASQLQLKVPQDIEETAKRFEAEGETVKASNFRKNFTDKYHVVYLDFEGTFDPVYAERIGLNCDEDHLTLIQPNTIEDGFNIAEEMVKTGSICCVILDSDAAATTDLDNKSEYGQTGFNGAKDAAVLSMAYKKFNVLARNYLTPLLVVSQERDNMNVMSHLPSQTGGKAIRFYATTRNRITKLDTIKNANGEDSGIQIRVRNYKNKGGIPWRDAEMNLYFEHGFDSDNEYFDFLVKFNIINKAGGWFDAPGIGMPKMQGAAKVKEWLIANPDIYNELKKQVNDKLVRNNELDNDNSNPEFDDAKEVEKKTGKKVEIPKEEDDEQEPPEIDLE